MKKSILIVFFIFAVSLLYSQITEDKVKIQYAYRFAKNIEWPKESLVDTFRVAYLGNNKKVETYFRLVERKTLHRLPIKIYSYDDIGKINLSKFNMVYVDYQYNNLLASVFNKIKNKNILLISDNYSRQKFVMLNFIKKSDKTISFEVNKKTIIEQNLKIKPKLLLLGGKEIDIRELYKKQEKELDKEKKFVEQQKKEIAKLNISIKAKQSELVEKENIIQQKLKELALQTKKLKEQQVIFNEIKTEVQESKNTLEEKVRALRVKENEIKEQNSIISKQTEKVEKAKQELQEVNKEILLKKAELKQKEKEIAKKEKELVNRDLTISSQKQWIVIGSIVLFIILVLSVLLIKLVRDKNTANEALRFKNIEINNKNSEINSQKEELSAQKEHIERQYGETQASISYARTIQATILPMKDTLNSFLKTFVIFRPKDVVSGDFYWHAKLPAKNGLSEKHFFAAVDCTGHGVPGAFMSMIGSRLLNEIVNEKKITNTAEILEELNKGITKSLKQEHTENRDGMDLCLCRIEVVENNKKLVSFSGAKLPLFYFNSESKDIHKIRGDRKSIGGSIYRNSNSMKFTVKEFTVNNGDIIYLTTDGYIDQNNKDRKRFGTSKFVETLKNISSKDLQEQKRVLENMLDKHQEDTEQRDDITVIGIKF